MNLHNIKGSERKRDIGENMKLLLRVFPQAIFSKLESTKASTSELANKLHPAIISSVVRAHNAISCLCITVSEGGKRFKMTYC
jgi:hypothetical protein